MALSNVNTADCLLETPRHLHLHAEKLQSWPDQFYKQVPSDACNVGRVKKFNLATLTLADVGWSKPSFQNNVPKKRTCNTN